MPLVAGQVFARDYRIERELSRGGMGQVYVALQHSTGRLRALKVMRPELAPDPAHRKRFEQEATVGAKIASGHIVEVIAAGVDEATGMPWLAMELLEGETLAEYVQTARGLAPREALEILSQIAHAIGAAHAVGVVHRDLKPENVFVATERRASRGRTVKVLDFGIAKVVAEARATATAPVGTLLWMAPEQADVHGVIGPRTDIWAFGLVAFHALTGLTFWDEAVSVPALLKQLTIDPIPDASARATTAGRADRLATGFDDWFRRCVARPAADRFESIGLAERALRAVLGDLSLSLAETEPLSPLASSRAAAAASAGATAWRPWPSVALVTLGAGVCLATAMLWQPWRGSATAAKTTETSHAPTAADAASATSPKNGNPEEAEQDTTTRFLVPLEDSPRRGAREPLVTIVEFGGFQCPFTAKSEETLKATLAAHPTDVALVWKDLLLDSHPIAEPAARLARLARQVQGEDGFWRAHDLLFSACSDNDRERLREVGARMGLAEAKVRAALDGQTPAAVERDADLAMKLGDFGAPTFFINGRRVIGAIPDMIASIVNDELTRARDLSSKGVPRIGIYAEIQREAISGQPRAREIVDVPSVGPVLAGAHAVVDVHAIGDETDVFRGLGLPVFDYVSKQYGDRIRLFWHWLPDRTNAQSLRIAALSRAVYEESGSEVFWRFHHLLLENQPRTFWNASRKPRGFGDEALLGYGREAGANPMYFSQAISGHAEFALPDASSPATWEARLPPAHKAGGMYAGGYWFGASRREAARILDELIAEKGAR